MGQSRTPSRRGPYTSRGKQERIKGRRMAGQTVRQIAEAEGVNKNTVARILSQSESNELIQGYRGAVLQELVPLAIDVYRKLLKKVDRQAATETLYGSGILFQKHQEIEIPQTQERDYSSSMVRYYYEYGRWPTKEEAKEFDKTIPVEPLLKGEAID